MNVNIAEVIGWTFNHQPGMRCAEDENGVLQIVAFPGGVPSQNDQDVWVAEYTAHLVAEDYVQKRKGTIADGGYGTWREQLEIIGEQGMDVFQTHVATVKATFPK